MRKNFEHFLLSLLLGLSVLLGLSFWLNTVYGFNLFDQTHWAELSRLQAEQIPISKGFYISIAVAIFVFVCGVCVIYIPKPKHTNKQQTLPNVNVYMEPPHIAPEPKKSDIPEVKSPKIEVPMTRPPRLNLPSNMAEVARQKHNAGQGFLQTPKQIETQNNNQYDSTLAQIFNDAGYMVKKNPVISGFTPNLFAIAPDEILWIGAVDTDINKLKSAIDRLESIFHETLEDIEININAFVIDTKNQQTSTGSITVLKSLDEFKTFVSKLPKINVEDMTDYAKDNFNAYSEYIDTIIQYVKNMG